MISFNCYQLLRIQVIRGQIELVLFEEGQEDSN
jgi:hypothetical protein